MNYLSNTNLQAFIMQFDAKHSELGEPVRDGHILLFPDGATRECSPLGLQMEPSTDRLERLKTVLQYWETKYAYAVDEAKRAYEEVRELTKVALKWGNCSVPGQGAIDKVNELKQKADDIKPQLEKARADFEVIRPRAYEGSSSIKAEAAAMLEQLNSIRI